MQWINKYASRWSVKSSTKIKSWYCPISLLKMRYLSLKFKACNRKMYKTERLSPWLQRKLQWHQFKVLAVTGVSVMFATSYLTLARLVGNSKDPDYGSPIRPANIPPLCYHQTPALDTSHCYWWAPVGRVENPILLDQRPAPTVQMCNCFFFCPHHVPSLGCNTCEGSKTENMPVSL